jgi:tetratricopeptide (TPR) repeat protein
MMKTIKIILTILILFGSRFAYSNYGTDENIIEARAKLYEAIQTFDQKKLIEAESLFERILSMDSKAWIAHYYIALTDEYISHTFYSDKDKQEKYINKGIDNLETCVELHKDFSEAYILLASLYGIKIGVNQALAVSLNSKASSALEKAKKIEPDNPRIYLIAARSAFYTPEIFGGGFRKAKEELNKALDLFPKYKPQKETYPAWGYDEVYSYLGQMAVQEEQFEQAKAYYSKALEINASNMYVKYKLMPMLENAMRVDKPVITPEGGIFLDNSSVKVGLQQEKYPVYYTLDGSEPTLNSPKYEGVLLIDKNTIIKVRAIANDKRQSEVVTAQYKTGKLTPSANVEGLKQGLRYSYYEGSWNKLPGFDTIKPVESGITSKISLDKKKRDDEFGFVFSGYIDILQAGEYVFYMRSDDGSKLSIDNKEVIDNDGLHGDNIERSYQILLDKGKHPIKLIYFEKKLGESLIINYKGPGIKKQELSGKILFYK